MTHLSEWHVLLQVIHDTLLVATNLMLLVTTSVLASFHLRDFQNYCPFKTYAKNENKFVICYIVKASCKIGNAL